MEVKKKKRIFQVSYIIGVTILIVFLFSVFLTSCRKTETFEEWFKRAWDIDLPKNMGEVFYKSDKMFGEGTTYRVLQSKEEPIDFLTDFFKEKDEKFEKAVNDEITFATEISPKKFEIPLNLLPDWDTAYYWKHIGKGTYWEKSEHYENNLYIVYFPEPLIFIFCESFT